LINGMTRFFTIPTPLPFVETELKELIGMQGASIVDLSARGVPFAFGLIAKMPDDITQFDGFFADLKSHGILNIEELTRRSFDNKQAPLTLSVTLLPDMVLDRYPRIDYLGFTDDTVARIADKCGKEAAYKAYRQLIETFSDICYGFSDADMDRAHRGINVEDHEAVCQSYLDHLTPDFPQSLEIQLELALRSLLSIYQQNFVIEDSSASFYIAYLPCISSKSETFQGSFLTRTISNGESTHVVAVDKEVSGRDRLVDEVAEISEILESYYLDIRQASYYIASGALFITRQNEVEYASTNARIRLLNDLRDTEKISEKEYLNSVSADELRSLLHSTVDQQSTLGLEKIQGGIAGSPGAAQGRVYFSSDKLLEAHQRALSKGEDSHFILMKTKTEREDIQAIERCTAVITSEGGYTSHAPIIARYLGKPAAVFTDLSFSANQARIGQQLIEEGTNLTLLVPGLDPPTIYVGKAKLIFPDFEKTALSRLLEQAKKHLGQIKIMANADKLNDAQHAKEFGADGIGLCRVEHLLLSGSNLLDFQALMTTDDEEIYAEKRADICRRLMESFVQLFEIMDGMPVIIRLMDAPLSEFFPENSSVTKFQEKNPMLGLRGCRTGITHPDIYSLQVRAILEAALLAKLEKGIGVFPHLLIPFVISVKEIDIIKYGESSEEKATTGIAKEIHDIQKKHRLEQLPFELKLGSIIELPAAAISAGEIATQVEFISFGTNDLTQTVLGISRDDLHTFLPNYVSMGVWQKDPFQTLVEPVKTIISQAIEASRQIRPDLMVGICGEQGADTDVVRFCLEEGMNYISCPPFEVPLAILAAAQINLEES